METVRIQVTPSVDAMMRGRDAIHKSRGAMSARVQRLFLQAFAFFLFAGGVFLVSVTPFGAPGFEWSIPPIIGMFVGGAAILGVQPLGHAIVRRKFARSLKQAEIAGVNEFSFTTATYRLRNGLTDIQNAWQISLIAIEDESGLLIKLTAGFGFWVDATWFHNQAEADQVVAWARAGARKYKLVRPIQVPPFKEPVEDFAGHES